MSPLGHPKVEPLTREIATDLGLDPAFVEFVFAEARPECFDYWVEPPENGWTCFVPERAIVAHPLWSSNADQTLGLVTNEGLEFGHAYHDDLDFNRVAGTSQGLLANLFIALYESDVSHSELQSAASFAGFGYLDRCIRFSEAEGDDPGNWEARKSAFIAEIDREQPRGR